MKKIFVKKLLIVFGIAALAAVAIFFMTQAQPKVIEPDPTEIDPKYMVAIELGAEWFLNNQDDNFLHYTYRPYDRSHDPEHHSMREMGAMWSIARLGNWLDDDRYRDLALKGFEYFERFFMHDRDDDFYFVNITPSKIKLGYNAFAILTLIELDYPNKDEILEKLANGILFQQEETGELRTFFYSKRDTGKDYYPGEALLSLMALYEYNGEKHYLEAVQKAFPFYREYWRDNPNTAFPPWQSRAYYKLYKATGDNEVRDFIYEMSDYMLEEYNPERVCSDFDFSGGSVAAVHAEGVNMAYDLSKNECYKNYGKEVADYIISLQITDTKEFDTPAIGGILGHEDSTSNRVDRNQHAVLMLMDAYDFGILN